jgi:methylated-DNA-protein-cysteine methyltransferase-like protein
MRTHSPAPRRQTAKSPNADRADVYAQIWKAVAEIPYGQVSTYGRIAALAGYDRQARMVGYALHSLPAGSDLPWHRVINAAGRISLPTDSDAYREQRQRLLSEGIRFKGDKVDLAHYAWQPSLDELLWGEH